MRREILVKDGPLYLARGEGEVAWVDTHDIVEVAAACSSWMGSFAMGGLEASCPA